MSEPIVCTNCGTESSLEACEYMYHERKCSTCGYCVDCEQYHHFNIEDSEFYKQKRFTEFPNYDCKIVKTSDIYIEHQEKTPVYTLLLLSKGITFQFEINEQEIDEKEITFFFLVHQVEETIIDTALSVERENKLWATLKQIYTREALDLFLSKLKMHLLKELENEKMRTN